MSAQPSGHSYETDPTLYLFTSLTAGSSHIITATSRLETILKANRIPFSAIDTATDEKARRIWVRRGQGRKLPGMVREGVVLADLEQVEEWNEYGELKDKLGSSSAPSSSTPSTTTTTSTTNPNPSQSQTQQPPSTSTSTSTSTPTIHTNQQSPADPSAASTTVADSSFSTPSSTTMRQVGEEAAAKAKSNSKSQRMPSSSGAAAGTDPRRETKTSVLAAIDKPPAPETMTSSSETNRRSIRIAEEKGALKARGTGNGEEETVRMQAQDPRDGEEAGTSVLD